MSKSAFLGWWGSDPASREPLVYQGDGSLVTVARPGSGKSRFVVLPNLIHLEGSVVVFDPKGELTRSSALWRKYMLAQCVIVFDPFRIVEAKYLPNEKGKSPYGSIDMIGAIRRSESPLTTALAFAEAMIAVGETREPHFPEGAQMIHAGLDLLVATDASLPDDLRNKRFAWSMFTDQKKFQAALETMASSEHEALRDQATAFLDVSHDDREMRGIKSTLRTQCSRTYSEAALMGTLCRDSADFSRINDEPMSVYIVLPGALAEVHFRWVKLILTYLLAEIERGGLRRFE